MATDDREHAWGDVHDAIARMPGWSVGPCTYHGEVALWHITAIDPAPAGSARETGGDHRYRSD